ncbi:transmembrane anterior posterior transformation protein 1 homolog isoform X1 [Labrus mixtus]|uniref:transmembrane anterior posterior transformation protein 1 homolog isoform X1 n=1 Tax=Labrus mixtus TaxID=508554 RepID=UPI0029C0D169|nr:transmembrane anterior posterior transformation protein 1 homolog isoform X1 [Labrus mixtus]XP_060903608.1 transmembrane anterior posterior transformation protein 1 homolog isoform X1 [Labrus mixtus]XP_060903609.1 transmembrane anterior posterior transformation protein 1 homolog isoform X1 [Labrus mixtus]
MADTSGTEQLSDEKETDSELKKRQKRPWEELHRSGKIRITPELPETLGFYDIGAVRREHLEQPADPSLTRFISAELTRGYFLEHNEAKYTERRERVYTCMRIPKELEKLMTFGLFLCVDAFLYVFTLLPLRVLLALLRLLTLPCCGFRARTCPYCRRSSGSRLLQPAQVCDMLKGLILVLCFSMMHYVDYSMMYHLIRGQSVIKLYIIYNMLEVADRLFSSFGQDILDALYWTATEPKERKRDSIGVIPHFIMAVFYVFLHSILIMVQASTLNVAFNSHNKSLLTIMLSNNFVEIKGSVFKKFGKNNLFQMSNSDIKERFTSYVLLLIVCLRNMEQFLWKPDHMWVMFPDVFMVISSEILVDIIKHAFITKFNDITADVYSEYRASLAFDLVSSRQKNACTDYSDSVARRMGFIPLPLAALLIRVVMSSVKVQGALSYTCVFLFYLGLVSLKVLNSIVLLGKSCIYVKRANMEDKLFEKPTATPSSSEKGPNQAEDRCPTPSGESKDEEIPTPLSRPPYPSCSVTTQPTPRTDLFPPPPTDSSSGATACTPRTPPPEPEQSATSLSKEEEEEEGEGEVKGDSELKHRTPKKDLLEIDRFTICGNRID